MSDSTTATSTENISVTGKRTTGRDKDTLYLEIGGKTYSGWDAVRVTRGVERMPSDFDISLTERYPGEASEIVIEPGKSCVVRLGDDRVITGWIDRYTPSYSASTHTVRVSGRGKCQDLVDCSAMVSSFSVGNAKAESLISTIIKPFGITVTNNITDSTEVVNTTVVPQFSVNLEESAWDIIDRITKWGGFLCYENTFGNLVMSQVGTDSMASGFIEGDNVEGASRVLAYDQRFSEYWAFLQSTDQMEKQLDANNLAAGPLTDSAITRYRPKVIISEQTVADKPIAEMRLTWERNRRVGRSQSVTLTCDSWRDSSGTLWTPNCLANVTLPNLKLATQTWLIGEVTYRRDNSGTHADILLMPKEAYSPEPNALQLAFAQIMASSNASASSD